MTVNPRRSWCLTVYREVLLMTRQSAHLFPLLTMNFFARIPSVRVTCVSTPTPHRRCCGYLDRFGDAEGFPQPLCLRP
jgi:hypothetical protein